MGSEQVEGRAGVRPGAGGCPGRRKGRDELNRMEPLTSILHQLHQVLGFIAAGNNRRAEHRAACANFVDLHIGVSAKAGQLGMYA